MNKLVIMQRAARMETSFCLNRSKYLLLLPVDRDTHEFFCRLQSNVFDAASLFLFKPITWYIEMHHVRTSFSVWRLGFFVLRDVHSQCVYLQEESLPLFLSCRMRLNNRSEFVLIIFYLQLLKQWPR